MQPEGRAGATPAPASDAAVPSAAAAIALGTAKAARARLVALVVLVTMLHLWLVDTAGVDRFGLGAAATAMPQRIQVAFVRELSQRKPPSVAPAATPQQRSRPLRQAARADLAASQAMPSDAGPRPEPEPVLALDTPASATATTQDTGREADLAATVAAASAPAAPASAVLATAQASAPEPVAVASGALADTAQSFAWPPSTRLSYTLTGNYRGPVEGQAQVEWLLDGARYQVHMELSIGPVFAPLASRRVSSEGLVSDQGLTPRRYDEVTRAMFRQPQSMTVWLDEGRVRLSNGREHARPAGVQDSASQFVHLTWLFTTQPALLRAGQSVTLPLALPRNLEPWVYDVLGAQTLATPAGEVEAFHVKPRRPARAGNDLTAEIWVAPSLQYLPVRIVIRQDAETFLDLLISRLPQQAAARP